MKAGASFRALVVALATMFVVERRVVCTHSLATNFIVSALASTFDAVKLICLHINTFFVAAVWPLTDLDATNSRIPITSGDTRGDLSARNRPPFLQES